jgi:hypothetical protein
VNVVPPALRAVLQDAQRAGAIGPGSIDDAVAHSRGFVHGIVALPGWQCVDLGSGGGLPGLPLALDLPDTQWTLVDAWAARADALARAIVHLGLGPRVSAIHGRAEELGRGSLRGRADPSSPGGSALPRGPQSVLPPCCDRAGCSWSVPLVRRMPGPRPECRPSASSRGGPGRLEAASTAPFSVRATLRRGSPAALPHRSAARSFESSPVSRETLQGPTPRLGAPRRVFHVKHAAHRGEPRA